MAVNMLDICHVNVRSLNTDRVDAIRAELAPDFDIICLTETNLPHANVDDLSITGFHDIIRKDRDGRVGGGVGVYVTQHLSATLVNDYNIPELEAMWVKIKAGHNTFMLCVCYRPPNSKPDFWIKFQDSIDLVKQSGINNLLLTGDFNADPHTRDGRILDLLVEANNFTLHVDKPTRITPTTATILDQFISNVPSLVCNVGVLDPISTCDHCPIKASFKMRNKYNKPKAYKRHIWQYHKADFNEFRQKLLEVDWEACFLYDDIDRVCEAWGGTFLNHCRKNSI